MTNVEEKLSTLKVIKRDGKKVDFNGTKIAVAIKKGFDSVNIDDEDPKYSEKDVNKVYLAVLARIEKEYVKVGAEKSKLKIFKI